MPTTFTGIQNENEFYSHHYLSELFANDIQATTSRWREAAGADEARTEGGRLIRPFVPWRIPIWCFGRSSAGNAVTRPA